MQKSHSFRFMMFPELPGHSKTAPGSPKRKKSMKNIDFCVKSTLCLARRSAGIWAGVLEIPSPTPKISTFSTSGDCISELRRS